MYDDFYIDKNGIK